MQRIAIALALAALIVAADCIAQAQASGDEVLAENAFVKLTRADYDTDLLRIPPESRREFAANPGRLTQMLNNLLLDKTLAKQARDLGLDRDAAVARRLALEVDRFLAQAMVAKIQSDAEAEFDAKEEEFAAKAHETYLVNKDKYRTQEQVAASHILFDPEKHGGSDAALALAKEARAKLAAGADFAQLAREVSDDEAAKGDGGKLGYFGHSRMDPDFTKAAFALKNVGDLSEPVKSAFGWHIIRLDGRRPAADIPFDKARKAIMAELKARYVKDALTVKINSIRTDPNMKVNQAAIDALVVKLPEPPRVPGPRAPEIK
jgi:peptidyl-prolyl cis-trans isomerase C